MNIIINKYFEENRIREYFNEYNNILSQYRQKVFNRPISLAPTTYSEYFLSFLYYDESDTILTFLKSFKEIIDTTLEINENNNEYRIDFVKYIFKDIQMA
jgi:hypothetical protein